MIDGLDGLSMALAAGGAVFFLAGSVGLYRLPDVYSRLHALTKADNVGFGLIVLAAMIQADDWLVVFKLALVWIFILIASACLCYLIARESLERGGSAVENNRP